MSIEEYMVCVNANYTQITDGRECPGCELPFALNQVAVHFPDGRNLCEACAENEAVMAA